MMKYLRNISVSNAWRSLMLITLLLMTMPLFAQGTPAGGTTPNPNTTPPIPAPANIATQVTGLNALTVLANIVQQVPYLMSMVTAIAYVLGMFFIISAITQFKHFGESRTMMSHEHSIVKPITMLAVGAALLYLPSSVQVGMSSFWANPNPYAYLEEQDQWSQVINDCYLVIQLIGTIAFIRGLVLLSHVGQSHGQGNFAKGLTHIIGGVLCINIYQFVQVILVTIGIQS